MKDMDVKERFIELRAKGYSFDRISDEINVSKPTLIKWHSEFEKEIVNLRYIQLEGLLERYGLVKQKKIEALAEVVERTMEEFRNRDLSRESLRHLIDLARMAEKLLKEEMEGITYYTGETKDILSSSVDDLLEHRIELNSL